MNEKIMKAPSRNVESTDCPSLLNFLFVMVTTVLGMGFVINLLSYLIGRPSLTPWQLVGLGVVILVFIAGIYYSRSRQS